jgi:hypothetical protein
LHEFVDVDGAGAIERDVVELVLVDGDVGVGVDLKALDDVVAGHFFAGLGVDLGVFDAVASSLVDLVEVEGDFLALRVAGN